MLLLGLELNISFSDDKNLLVLHMSFAVMTFKSSSDVILNHSFGLGFNVLILVEKTGWDVIG